MIRNLTESGDWYVGTEATWSEYREAVRNGDWGKVLYLEEGNNEDFFYDPQE